MHYWQANFRKGTVITKHKKAPFLRQSAEVSTLVNSEQTNANLVVDARNGISTTLRNFHRTLIHQGVTYCTIPALTKIQFFQVNVINLIYI